MTVNVWVEGSTKTAHDLENAPFKQLGITMSDVTTVAVSSDGLITKTNASSTVKNIGVTFANNAFRESDLEDNPELLDNILMSEYKDKNFDTINMIGHSNGGNAIVHWIERFQKFRPFKVNVLVTTCTPFNGYAKWATPNGFLKEILADKGELNGITKYGFVADIGEKVADINGAMHEWDSVVTLDNAYTGEQVFGQPFKLLQYMPDGSFGVSHMDSLKTTEVLNVLRTLI